MSTKYIYISLLLANICQCELAFSQKNKVDVAIYLDDENVDQMYSDDKTKCANIKKAVQAVKAFLSNPSFSSELQKAVFTLTQGPSPIYFLYEIYGVCSVTQSSIVLIINSYQFFDTKEYNNSQGYFKVGYDIRNGQITFPVYDSRAYVVNFKHVIFHSINKPDKKTLKSTNKFIAVLSKQIKLNYPKFDSPINKLSYIIGDNFINALDYFSLYNFYYTSSYYGKINTLFDVLTNGNYKHEIIHYLFSNYEFNYLLSEGMATYLSGGKSRFKSSFLNDFAKIQEKIKSDTAYASSLDNLKFTSDYRYTKEVYVISALLLLKYNQQVGSKQFFKSVFEEVNSLSDQDFLNFFLKKFKFNNLCSYLLNTSLENIEMGLVMEK